MKVVLALLAGLLFGAGLSLGGMTQPAVVLGFLDGQHDLARSPAKQGAFLPVWMDIGRTLGDRIAREEKTLYPMYQDSH